MAKIIHSVIIPNLPGPNQDVSRRIDFYGLNVDGFEETATIPYAISYFKNGVDVSNEWEKQGKPMQWTNNNLVYQRDLTTGQPLPNPAYEDALIKNKLPQTIPNPEYIDEETTPDISPTIVNSEYVSDAELLEIGEFLTAPAFTYFITIFHSNPEIFWDFIDMYIDENYGEGWYGTQSKNTNRK